MFIEMISISFLGIIWPRKKQNRKPDFLVVYLNPKSFNPAKLEKKYHKASTVKSLKKNERQIEVLHAIIPCQGEL
jgi:hypothetical protein